MNSKKASNLTDTTTTASVGTAPELPLGYSMKKKFSPDSMVRKRYSALEKFRKSKAYKDLKKAQEDKAESLIEYIVAGGTVENAINILNDRDLKVESVDTLADQVITKLINGGFDSQLVDVLIEGNKIYVYLDSRVGEHHMDISQMLSTEGQTELLSKPSEDEILGLYKYVVQYKPKI